MFRIADVLQINNIPFTAIAVQPLILIRVISYVMLKALPHHQANECFRTIINNAVSGNVRGEPPYRGVLRHPGWRSRSLRLPECTGEHDSTILAPAEVEIE